MRFRLSVFLLFAASWPAAADDILFIGNSFTFGGAVPALSHHGGVPALVEEIARARGHQLAVASVTAPGVDWSYHLAQPRTTRMLGAKVWTWVVLQDVSTGPTRIGNLGEFAQGGEAFSKKIAENSPHAGIVLYETWARPSGAFYQTPPGNSFSGPAQMLTQLHDSYSDLGEALAVENKDRPVRVALVGDAFARCQAEWPFIDLYAADRHHASADGYYLAALIIYETLYRESVKGAPELFFHGSLVISSDEAAKLQRISDEICGSL